jgi:hypothetical protein
MLCNADAEEYSYLIEMMPFDVEVEESLSHEDAAEQMQKHKVAISWAFSQALHRCLGDQDSGELNSSVGNLTWSS